MWKRKNGAREYLGDFAKEIKENFFFFFWSQSSVKSKLWTSFKSCQSWLFSGPLSLQKRKNKLQFVFLLPTSQLLCTVASWQKQDHPPPPDMDSRYPTRLAGSWCYAIACHTCHTHAERYWRPPVRWHHASVLSFYGGRKRRKAKEAGVWTRSLLDVPGRSCGFPPLGLGWAATSPILLFVLSPSLLLLFSFCVPSHMKLSVFWQRSGIYFLAKPAKSVFLYSSSLSCFKVFNF